MQATIDSTGLKHLNRALTCLSKYGDELTMVATHETFALSSTNQSQSAYGRFKYSKSFFSKYRLEEGVASDRFDEPTITCQIVTKILKHKTIEKSCEKCELVISDGATQEIRLQSGDEERDTLESRLTVRLHCKHGVIKTHRVPLNPADNLMFPMMPDAGSESRLTIGPKALKNMLEHFPFGKGSKSDPQLVWNFTDTEVQLRSLETSVDAKGRTNLTTELTISAEEFDDYWIQCTPATIAFHLREFNATIAFAEASSLSLEIRFTEPDAPIYIDAGNDLADTLFVIAASTVQSVSPHSSQARRNDAHAQAKGKKRPLEEDTHQRNAQFADRDRPHNARAPRPLKPMKVVHRADRASIAREMHPPPSSHGPQPSWAILTAAQVQYRNANGEQGAGGSPSPSLQPLFRGSGPSQLSQGRSGSAERVPLFLPGSQLSQLPRAAEAAIIESGLGIENMTAEELENMLEGDAEEVEFATQTDGHRPNNAEDVGEEPEKEWPMSEGEAGFQEGGYGQNTDSFELLEDVEMEPTQNDGGAKVFRPLFED
ncbi:Rad9-domain-containing protein [Trametes maxima]|nr:Rad9-domain-containing protein [Trametes maxima]